jgi:CrcB protein
VGELSIWLAVGIGGALGAVLRGLVYLGLERWSPADRGTIWAKFGASRSTLFVNILGSFVLGVVIARLGVPALGPPEPIQAFWLTGICGALTTFSALCADAIGLARRGNRMHVAGVLLANVILGVFALSIGLSISS